MLVLVYLVSDLTQAHNCHTHAFRPFPRTTYISVVLLSIIKIIISICTLGDVGYSGDTRQFLKLKKNSYILVQIWKSRLVHVQADPGNVLDISYSIV